MKYIKYLIFLAVLIDLAGCCDLRVKFKRKKVPKARGFTDIGAVDLQKLRATRKSRYISSYEREKINKEIKKIVSTAQFKEAMGYFKESKYDEAISVLERLLIKYPGNVFLKKQVSFVNHCKMRYQALKSTNLNAAARSFLEGRTNDAIRLANDVLSVADNNIYKKKRALYILYRAYKKEGLVEKAREYLSTYTKLNTLWRESFNESLCGGIE